ncbi:MAG: TetR/AcrR family transcriptional regulator [Candidatus Hydrogenedentes bacterium]|nr:TetR/AcrR family transcriptional regulator [Candidatus Hydrogenedentota bacterium]
MAKSASKSKRAERPNQILQAATKIIGQHGYYGFSIQSLADACGLTVAGILHHFGSKEAILIAVLKHHDERDFDVIWRGIAIGDASVLEALSLSEIKSRLRTTMLHNSRQPNIMRLVSMLRTEALYPSHPAYKYFQQRHDSAIQALTTMLAGKVPSPDRRALLVAALIVGLDNIWLDRKRKFDLAEYWDEAIEKILG